VFHHVGFFIALSVVERADVSGLSQRWQFLNNRERAMSMIKEMEYQHLGETRGVKDHDHDLIHELSRRLDCLWRYDQYIANASDQQDLQEFWRDAKSQEQKNIDRLKQLLKQHIQANCF
jgi:hypothetical protein